MNFSKSSKPQALSFSDHHAYFIEGEKELVLKELEDFFLNELKFDTKGNPDYMRLSYENFSIDDARGLKEMHSSAAVGQEKDARRIFVISFGGATGEAQNSLLKMFEEPNATSRFFVIAPSVNILLPTLRSRFEIIKTTRQDLALKSNLGISAKDFISMSLSERMKVAKTISEKITKETFSKSDVLEFLKDVSDELRKNVIAKKANPKQLEEALKSLSYISDRSSSVKMLLEHLAMSL